MQLRAAAAGYTAAGFGGAREGSPEIEVRCGGGGEGGARPSDQPKAWRFRVERGLFGSIGALAPHRCLDISAQALQHSVHVADAAVSRVQQRHARA